MLSIHLPKSEIRKLTRQWQRREGELRAGLEALVGRKGLEIETDTKHLAPVDTGRLRASYHTTHEGLEAKVGTDVVYAPAQEYEHTAHLRPAINKHRDDFPREVLEVLRS